MCFVHVLTEVVYIGWFHFLKLNSDTCDTFYVEYLKPVVLSILYFVQELNFVLEFRCA